MQRELSASADWGISCRVAAYRPLGDYPSGPAGHLPLGKGGLRLPNGTDKIVLVFGARELTFLPLAGIIYAEILGFQISKSKGGAIVF